jgi:sigma-B regulation protein RsbU (phosphoserine phosphatase)
MTEARLQVIDSQGRRVVPLDKPVFIIGRRTAADLQLVDAGISREHAEIERVGLQYMLRDRGSRYGTFVNGEQVTERPLEHGDRIRLGRTEGIELVFMTETSTHASGLREAASEAGDLRQMAAILNGLRALGTGRVLEEVLTLVLDSALDVTKAERGFIMLARPDGELEFKIARGLGRVTLSGTSFTTSSKIPREVFITGQSRIVGDLMDGNLAGMHDGTIAIGIRHVLCVPLSVNPMGAADSGGRHVIGVLYLDGRERSTMLSQATRSSLEAFATQAALAIDSARLYAESAEKARTDRDLRIAAEIQRALLPEPSYQSPAGALAASSIPCRTVGGDFFDYIEVADGGLGFALGDVAGKGPPAALLAAAVQSNFAAQAPVTTDPADTMARVNKALLRRAIEARFATMFYGVVFPDGSLRYCNAGQEPPLVIRRSGIAWLDEGGPVLGLLTIATYRSGGIQLEPGDLVVVCSDGVTEARNQEGEEFGRERLVDALARTHGSKPEAVLDLLLSTVRKYSEGAAQGDDITAMVLRCGDPARA